MQTSRFVFISLFIVTATFPCLAAADDLVNQSNLSHPDETSRFYQSRQERDKKDHELRSRLTEDERSFEEKLIDEIPYGDRAKHLWKVVDGDVDLYFAGLRADRGNKGIAYKTNALPLIGDVDGLELKFEVGEDNKFSFKSQKLPFIDPIEGLSFRGSVGEESQISARYTIAFD